MSILSLRNSIIASTQPELPAFRQHQLQRAQQQHHRRRFQRELQRRPGGQRSIPRFHDDRRPPSTSFADSPATAAGDCTALTMVDQAGTPPGGRRLRHRRVTRVFRGRQLRHGDDSPTATITPTQSRPRQPSRRAALTPTITPTATITPTRSRLLLRRQRLLRLLRCDDHSPPLRVTPTATATVTPTQSRPPLRSANATATVTADARNQPTATRDARNNIIAHDDSRGELRAADRAPAIPRQRQLDFP